MGVGGLWFLPTRDARQVSLGNPTLDLQSKGFLESLGLLAGSHIFKREVDANGERSRESADLVDSPTSDI